MIKEKQKILFITRSSEEGGEAVFIHKVKVLLKSHYFIKTCSLLGNKNLEQEDKIFLDPKFLFNKPIVTLRSLSVLMKEMRDADVIEHFVFGVYSILFFFIGHLYRKRIVITFHTNLESLKKSRYLYDRILKLFVINYFIFFTDKAVFLTRSQLLGFRKFCLFKKIFDTKTVVIRNFIEEEKIKNSLVVGTPINVLFVGRYSKQKGFFDLLNVAKQVSDVTFSFIGEDEFDTNLSNIKNLGKIGNSKIMEEYDKCSVFILPSYTEVFPMSILEAMARGLVVLVSDLPGMREIVQEGRNGYLFQSGDVVTIKKLILFLKNNPKEVEKVSKNNLKDIFNYTNTKQILIYKELYKVFP